MTGLLTQLGELVRVVTRGVGDASAHALAGLSHSRQPERISRVIARHNLATDAANSRLDDLLEELTGADGVLRNMRESVYKSYFKAWLQTIPEEYRIEPNPQATPQNIAKARALAVNGVELRIELTGAINAAKVSLGKVAATSSLLDQKQVERAFRDWRIKTIESINRAADLAHGDASILIERMAGVDILNPELLDHSVLEQF